MKDNLFNLNNLRVEISFRSFDELRKILNFYQGNNLYKINIPCKNILKKEFLIESIKISRSEYPCIDIIPHFSIQHEFRGNKINTLASFYDFIQVINDFGCKELLLVSGSQKRSTLDSVSALDMLRDHPLLRDKSFSIGVAFNPYLPKFLFEEEILRLEKKLESGLVSSIWIQFGTDYSLLKNRMERITKIITRTTSKNSSKSKIVVFGSILIPSKQFLARFKYRPWKGVYCSDQFLSSVDVANQIIKELLKTYKDYKIFPIIETNTSTKDYLDNLKRILTNE